MGSSICICVHLIGCCFTMQVFQLYLMKFDGYRAELQGPSLGCSERKLGGSLIYASCVGSISKVARV